MGSGEEETAAAGRGAGAGERWHQSGGRPGGRREPDAGLWAGAEPPLPAPHLPRRPLSAAPWLRGRSWDEAGPERYPSRG